MSLVLLKIADSLQFKTILVFQSAKNKIFVQINMENVFVTFYSKIIIQNFLSSNEQKVTSNEQKVTSNEQKVTINEQKATSNEQKVTSNEQRAKSFTSFIFIG